jgi:hypothetical protein
MRARIAVLRLVMGVCRTPLTRKQTQSGDVRLLCRPSVDCQTSVYSKRLLSAS